MEEEKCLHRLKRQSNKNWRWDICLKCGKVIGSAKRSKTNLIRNRFKKLSLTRLFSRINLN